MRTSSIVIHNMDGHGQDAHASMVHGPTEERRDAREGPNGPNKANFHRAHTVYELRYGRTIAHGHLSVPVAWLMSLGDVGPLKVK